MGKGGGGCGGGRGGGRGGGGGAGRSGAAISRSSYSKPTNSAAAFPFSFGAMEYSSVGLGITDDGPSRFTNPTWAPWHQRLWHWQAVTAASLQGLFVWAGLSTAAASGDRMNLYLYTDNNNNNNSNSNSNKEGQKNPFQRPPALATEAAALVTAAQQQQQQKEKYACLGEVKEFATCMKQKASSDLCGWAWDDFQQCKRVKQPQAPPAL